MAVLKDLPWMYPRLCCHVIKCLDIWPCDQCGWKGSANRILITEYFYHRINYLSNVWLCDCSLWNPISKTVQNLGHMELCPCWQLLKSLLFFLLIEINKIVECVCGICDHSNKKPFERLCLGPVRATSAASQYYSLDLLCAWALEHSHVGTKHGTKHPKHSLKVWRTKLSKMSLFVKVLTV